ncbi:redoxin domain-containing protein [Alicyclobacillus cycloheptanicus]|uniref:Cytochrome oxidase Cu insertion factor (SCO1/SenC/PrrC family) n=1 Tax=Alicyclobacillus cycloheptanicus TaxID=1457 RepID=A0ABT9XFL9_9BACL|nr:redoxin domain-containing protein [Alicyclobacillus cycloheptanicus]MDQ0188628.1 cytochrome oxidase Cu insertion factor (SCO1/SenC/PrrC family) [Alicyclobacillus cycloheptanicus]WDM00696.1 redoxin domain-containing protein [Alicyclobacillus cycloheptanicus]
MAKTTALWVGLAAAVVFVGLAWIAWLWLRTDVEPAASMQGTSVSSGTGNPVDAGTTLDGKPAPGFTLTDQYGRTFSLSQFKGKVVLLAFVDSECTNICPLTTAEMVNAVQMLGPQAAKHIQMLGVNANPEARSIADVKQYSVEHGMMNSWHFGTGSVRELKSIWKQYNIYDQIVNGDIDHTPALYIIDPQGRERVIFLTPSQFGAVSAESSAVAKQIAKYLPAGVKVNPPTVQYQAPTAGPGTAVQLPRATAAGVSGKVAVGPGRPQLLVFFASWASDGQTELQALNAYAKQAGSPQVVAVDVATTEPNSQALSAMLRDLPALNYPVAIDQTGEVADAYEAADIPWLCLTDGKGHIVWSHDGFVSTASLTQVVHKKLHVAA